MSKPIPKWTAVVAKGVLTIEARALFKSYVARLKDGVYSLTLTPQARPKSHSQLGYLWGVIYPVIADHFGYQPYEHEAVHDELMRVLRGLKPAPNPLNLRVSLSEMSHEEVSAYIEDVRAWALDQGIVTPDAERVVVPEARPRKAA